MTRSWIIEKGRWGPRMVLLGPWSQQAREAAESEQVKELELNQAKGWIGDQVSFLPEVGSSLEWFRIIDFSIENVAPINSLTSLRFLDVNTYCKTEIQFSRMPLLEECALEWRPRVSNLFRHDGLKKLSLNKYPGRDLTDFSQMSQLETLVLMGPPRLESCMGIGSLGGLVSLEISRARKLTDISALSSLSRLERLELHSCRNIEEISSLASLSALKELFLCDCGRISSLQPLDQLADLEKLVFTESTNVADGDLSPLERLPRLISVVFQERRHYSHKRRDFRAD